MDKNWLIRTKSNHILGPVSKEKALELFNNGSIKPDDELCSANGFWFFIREEEMVEKYLKGNETQGFNPISEAKDVLTQSEVKHTLDQSQDEITMVGNNVSMAKLRQKETAKEEGLAEVTPIRSEGASEGQPKKKSKPTPVEKVPRVKKVHKKQSIFQYLFIIGFIVLFCLVYFRKHFIRSIFTPATKASSLFIPNAFAQDEGQLAKKKSC
jgi:hypothetical protein